MDLTQEQKQSISQWTKEGIGLSDIQKKLLSDYGVSITYMDLRLLVLDLSLTVKDKQSVHPKDTTGRTRKPTPTDDAAFEPDDAEPPARMPGEVSVTMDRVVRAGSMASGSVTFSDGVSATWMLDQIGRLGLTGTKEGYKPSQRDLVKFQEALKRNLESKAF